MNKPLPDNPGHIQILCTRLDLASPRRRLDRVYGGFHHRMWRLETDRGVYAIKQLSVDTDLSDADVCRHYNVTEAVADAFARHGIPAIHAVQGGTGYLQLVGDEGYLVYPWSSAVALGMDEVTQEHACEVARVLARMHGADITVPGLREQKPDFHPEERIVELVKMAGEYDVEQAPALREALPAFLSMLDSHRAANSVLEKHRVISHGDLDHKNVLWDAGGKPLLIDWESARRLNPTYEILLDALDWSGMTKQFDQELFCDILTAYQNAGGVIDGNAIAASLDCILGDWLNWLMYNVGRSVDTRDAEQRAVGAAQTNHVLATMMRLQHYMPDVLSVMEERSVAAERAQTV